MEDDYVDDMESPTWEFMVQSPTLEANVEQVTSNYKIKLRYGGYFRLAKNSSKRRYRFGHQKSIYIDAHMYNFDDLLEDIRSCYPSNRDLVFAISFIDKNASDQSFIMLDSQEIFQSMLSMFDVEKELTIYVTTSNNIETSSSNQRCRNDVEQPNFHEGVHGEDEPEYPLSDESYHSLYSTDDEVDPPNSQKAIYSKKSPIIKVNSRFENVTDFRKTLIHYAIVNEFEYNLEKSEPTRVTAICTNQECKWRIHASVNQDGITFQVKTFVDTHSCIRSNKGGIKLASQGWVASVVKDKLKSDGDVSAIELQKWIMKNYNVEVPYFKVFRGKEEAYNGLYGKWEDSFEKIHAFIKNKQK